MRRFLLYVLAVGLLLTLPAGCFPRAVSPIPVVEYDRTEASQQRNLLVLLRGLGGNVDDFETYGIVAEVRNRGLPFDIVVPDAHSGYYRSETIEERLKQDVIDPARARGYRQIWLAGFSMGGLGSLFYIRKYPLDIDRVILCSPFLGWSSIRGELRRAGGVSSWEPEEHGDSDWQELIWKWIKEYGQVDGAGYPPIYLGYGTGDILTGDGPALLAEVLPPGRVFTRPGNHTYQTFRTIWLAHLDRLDPELKLLP
jgi:pimeloyl-ACP methyl ester carboxylesterase